VTGGDLPVVPTIPRRPLALTAAVLAVACGRPRPAGEGASAAAAADSLVVERSPCFGACPVYRVRLTPAGDVRYEPRQPGRGPAVDSAVITARVDPGTLAALLAAAEADGVFMVPQPMVGTRDFCPVIASDHSTVTVTAFAGAVVRRIEDDLGCRAASDTSDAARRLARLRAWEARVDSTIGAARWARRP
jgi:hypothetical protein